MKNVDCFFVGYVDTVYVIIIFLPSANMFCLSTTVYGSGLAEDQTGQSTNTVAGFLLYTETETSRNI